MKLSLWLSSNNNNNNNGSIEWRCFRNARHNIKGSEGMTRPLSLYIYDGMTIGIDGLIDKINVVKELVSLSPRIYITGLRISVIVVAVTREREREQ